MQANELKKIKAAIVCSIDKPVPAINNALKLLGFDIQVCFERHFSLLDIDPKEFDVLVIACESVDPHSLLTASNSVKQRTILWYEKGFFTDTDIHPYLASNMSCFQWPEQENEMSAAISILIEQNEIASIQELTLIHDTLRSLADGIVAVNSSGEVMQVVCNRPELLLDVKNSQRGRPWYEVVKINTIASPPRVLQFISTALRTPALTRLPPVLITDNQGQNHLIDGFIVPLTGESDNNGAALLIRHLVSYNRSLQVSANESVNMNNLSAIIMVSPDNLKAINNKQGRQAGDAVINAISKMIRQTIPATSIVHNVGGAIFSILLKNHSSERVDNVASLLHQVLSSMHLSEDKTQLTFTVSVAKNIEQKNQSLLSLFYQANDALIRAQQAGGATISEANDFYSLQQVGDLDRVSGNFSSKASSGFHGLLLGLEMLSNDFDNLEGEEFWTRLLQALVNNLDLLEASFIEMDGEKLSSCFTAASDVDALSFKPLNLTLAQRKALNIDLHNMTRPVALKTLRQDMTTEVLLPVLKTSNRNALILLRTKPQRSLDTKNYTLLENIVEFVKLRLQLTTVSQPSFTKLDKQNASSGQITYRSSEMAAQIALLEQVAPTNATVLITGESGTGKELLAKRLHERSERSNKPFIVFDCGAVVTSLIESELFGHIKGAFTSANQDKSGAIASAQGGTLFIDEVGDLPIDVQAKLLRFVQERHYSRIGEQKLVNADVRVVAATNVDLHQRIKEGKFREDLYYRLNVINIKSLPLRARRDDILPIAYHYLNIFAQQYQKHITSFSEDAEKGMMDYSWRGNVRELVNLVHRASVVCSETTVSSRDLGLYPEQTSSPTTNDVLETTSQNVNYNSQKITDTANNNDIWGEYVTFCIDMHYEGELISYVEARLFAVALSMSDGVLLRASGLLGVSEPTFRRKWQKLQNMQVTGSDKLDDYVNKLTELLVNQPHLRNRLNALKERLVFTVHSLGYSVSKASFLLGISPPTYRKLLSIIQKNNTFKIGG